MPFIWLFVAGFRSMRGGSANNSQGKRNRGKQKTPQKNRLHSSFSLSQASSWDSSASSVIVDTNDASFPRQATAIYF
jgi:hypothetical protein